MKHMKRLASILLTLVILVTMAVPAFAAQTGNLIIDGTVEGKKYDLYRVFDLTHSVNTDGTGNYSYTVSSNFSQYFVDNEIDDPVAHLESLREEPEELSELAQSLLAWAIKNDSPVQTVTGADGTTTVTGLDYGYYLLNPLGGSVPKEGYATMFALNTLSGKDTKIVVKTEYPTLDKTIEDDAKANAASVGDDVTFKLATKVPDMTGYERYYFVVTDTLSEVLTHKQVDSITIGGKTLNEGEDYYVETTQYTDGRTLVRIIFKDFIQYVRKTGSDVVITYTATLNDDAAIGTPNKNEAVLTYPNDPKYDYNGEGNYDPNNPDNPFKPVDPDNPPDDPDEPFNPNAPIGNTPKSETETFTTSLTITKKDDKGGILTGAAFRISGDGVNMVVTTGDVYVADENGTYYKLEDGTYTTTKPADYNGVKYVKEMKTTITNDEINEVYVEAFVDERGKLTFAGLGAGTYTISEIVTPKGFNAIEDFEVTINFDPETKAFSATRDGDSITAADNLLAIDVVNQSGTVLPGTGGVGTTLFYALGGALALGSMILLIVKKCMIHEK